jgi:hypothetical protein
MTALLVVEPQRVDLTQHDRNRLDELEAEIRAGIKTFYTVGAALREIRDSRLYREVFSTFDEYIVEVWGFRKSRAYQLIDAADKTDDVSTICGDHPPENEAQVRELRFCSREMNQEAWKRAVETAPDTGVTARHVSSVVRQMVRERLGPQAKEPSPAFYGKRDIDRQMQKTGGVISQSKQVVSELARMLAKDGEPASVELDRCISAAMELQIAWKAWKGVRRQTAD